MCPPRNRKSARFYRWASSPFPSLLRVILCFTISASAQSKSRFIGQFQCFCANGYEMSEGVLNGHANNAVEMVPPARRPGPRKGMPRPPGAGRKKGTPNRATRDVREATQKKGAAALRLLWRLCNSKDEKVADAALARWLAYAFGRPVDRQELTGPDGAPLNSAPPMGDVELARLLAFSLAKGAKEAEAPAPRPVRKPVPIPAPAPSPPAPLLVPVPPPPPAEPLPFPEARPAPIIHTPALLRRAND